MIIQNLKPVTPRFDVSVMPQKQRLVAVRFPSLQKAASREVDRLMKTIEDYRPDLGLVIGRLLPAIAGGATEMSDVLENEILNRYLRNTTAITPSATVYAALHTAAGASESNAAWAATETANSNGYARTALTFGSAASGGAISNTAACTFPVATPAGYASAITHMGIWDSATYGGGNILFYTALDSSVTVNLNDQVSFAIGAVSVTMT